MRIPLSPTSVRLTRWTKPLPRLAVGGAWLFILFSFAHLAWVVGVKWGDPAGVTTLYQTAVGEEVHRAWGLAYIGTFGLLLALAEAAAVVAATVMTLRPRPRPRRIGHLVLIAWSALWALNLIRLAGLDLQLDTTCQAMIMTLLFGCTVYRAARGHNLPQPRKQGASTTAIAPKLTPDHVIGSDEVRDITDAVKAEPPSLPVSSQRVVPRVKSGLRRSGVVLHHGWNRLKPLAASVGRGAAARGRKLTAYLRGKGVIPQTKRSTTT